MIYTIENEKMKVSVKSHGAELCCVICKADGVEHVWKGDPAVWHGQAPILFPYAGRLKGGKYTAKGQIFEGRLHGFARNFEHSLVRCEGNELVMEFLYSDETLALWPYRFRLESTFLLDGDTLHHTLRVENLDEESISFGIGFHPGFAIPFDDRHTYSDYELRFDTLESPVCLSTANEGLVGNETYFLGKNITAIPIDDQLFANDSHLMVGLHSKTLGIYEKDSGRAVVTGISAFPYVLIWSEVGEPQFVCLEPWQSIPSTTSEDISWENKPAAACIAPGESYSTTMSTAFVR